MNVDDLLNDLLKFYSKTHWSEIPLIVNESSGTGFVVGWFMISK